MDSIEQVPEVDVELAQALDSRGSRESRDLWSGSPPRVKLWHVFVGALLFTLAIIWTAHSLVDAVCSGTGAC